MQGAAVVGVEDSPGLDVGDGALDDLADPVDAPYFPSIFTLMSR